MKVKSTGYIVNGVYYAKHDEVPMQVDSRSEMEKQYSHDMQRENHKRDLIQPYDRTGAPNPEFIEQYPTEAQQYGFINNS